MCEKKREQKAKHGKEKLRKKAKKDGQINR
jgi:hypothetical protein